MAPVNSLRDTLNELQSASGCHL